MRAMRFRLSAILVAVAVLVPGGSIFTELRPYLQDAWELAKDVVLAMAQEDRAKAHVVTRYRDGNSNLRTQLERIIAKAGLKPWPKLFQNLRATRATELAAEFPSHVAAEWGWGIQRWLPRNTTGESLTPTSPRPVHQRCKNRCSR